MPNLNTFQIIIALLKIFGDLEANFLACGIGSNFFFFGRDQDSILELQFLMRLRIQPLHFYPKLRRKDCSGCLNIPGGLAYMRNFVFGACGGESHWGRYIKVLMLMW